VDFTLAETLLEPLFSRGVVRQTHTVFGINDIAAVVPFPFCYNCPACFDLSNSASERWFAFFARNRVSAKKLIVLGFGPFHATGPSRYS